jgi:putative transcriptional regulator
MQTSTPMAAKFRLAELLEVAGLSQRELSRRAGVSPTTINHMCANKTAQVSLKTLDSIATVLACAPGDLIASDTPKRRSR